jgi:hypothetical protein
MTVRLAIPRTLQNIPSPNPLPSPVVAGLEAAFDKQLAKQQAALEKR